MADIRLKNVPNQLHERLQRQARKRKTTLDDVVLSMLEREMGRLEFREDVVDKAGLVVTHAPYDLIALVRARSKAPLNRVNGSTRSSPGTASFPVENVPDDLHERLRRQASNLNTEMETLTLDALEIAMDRVEFYERMAAKPVKEFSISPSELLARERAQRDAPIEF